LVIVLLSLLVFLGEVLVLLLLVLLLILLGLVAVLLLFVLVLIWFADLYLVFVTFADVWCWEIAGVGRFQPVFDHHFGRDRKRLVPFSPQLVQLDSVLVLQHLGIAAIGELERLAAAIRLWFKCSPANNSHSQRHALNAEIVVGRALELEEAVRRKYHVLARFLQLDQGRVVDECLDRIRNRPDTGVPVHGAE